MITDNELFEAIETIAEREAEIERKMHPPSETLLVKKIYKQAFIIGAKYMYKKLMESLTNK